MKNFFILIILGFVFVFLITADYSKGFDFNLNRILDQYFVSKSKMLSMVAGFEAEKGESEKATQSFSNSKEAVDKVKDATKRVKESLNVVDRKLDTGSEAIIKTVKEDIDNILGEIKNIPEKEKKIVFDTIANILPKVDLKPQDLSTKIEDLEDESSFLFNVVTFYLKEGKQDLAIEVINKIPDEYYKQIAIMVLLNKSFDDNLIQEFQDFSLKEFVYLNHLRNILGIDDLVKAQDFVDSFEDDSLAKKGWLEIVNFQIKKGNIDEAIQILQTEIY